MRHEFDDELGDHVDGTLATARAAALEAHLASCDRCRGLTADFRALRAVAGTLERRTPAPHVWTRIAAGVAPPAAKKGWLFQTSGAGWRVAAAAAVVVGLLAAGTWFSWREVADSHGATAPAPPEAGTVAPADPAGIEQAMRSQISHMEGIVRTESSVLPGETQAAFQAGISDLDDALDSPSAVLADEPSDEIAQQSLLELLRSKLALLQEMIALINEMRKGNQEEAARIVSEGDQP
jgi:hypothetical protein